MLLQSGGGDLLQLLVEEFIAARPINLRRGRRKEKLQRGLKEKVERIFVGRGHGLSKSAWLSIFVFVLAGLRQSASASFTNSSNKGSKSSAYCLR